MNTLFSHKVSHQITWIANDRQINTTTTMAPSALQKSDRIYHRKTDPQNFDLIRTLEDCMADSASIHQYKHQILVDQNTSTQNKSKQLNVQNLTNKETRSKYKETLKKR